MLVSTIICTYNYGHFVGEAIQSVLAQGVDDHEIIVIDNGSTDQTADVLRRFQSSTVRVIHLQHNVGLGGGLNVGLREAQGKFLTFLDADDRWLPGKLRDELLIMESEPDVGLVFGNLRRFSRQGYLPDTQFDLAPQFLVAPTMPTSCGIGRRMLADCFETLVACTPMPCWIQAMMVRADAAQNLLFPIDRRPDPDFYYCLRLWPKVKAVYRTELVAELRRHEGNNTLDIAKLEASVYNTLIELAKEGGLSHGQKHALHSRIARTCISRANACMREKRLKNATMFLFRAIRFDPLQWKNYGYLGASPFIYRKRLSQPQS